MRFFSGLAGLVELANHAVGWEMPLFILPVALLMYRSFLAYFGQTPKAAPSPRSIAARAGR